MQFSRVIAIAKTQPPIHLMNHGHPAELHYSVISPMTRFRFTIRTLLWCVSTLCVVFAITTWWWRAYCRQDATVSNLDQIDAMPHYLCESYVNDHENHRRPAPWFYEFVQQCEPVLDRDMFYSIGGVQYESARNITAKQVVMLRTFSRLQWVDLAGQKGVTDAAVKDLSAIKSLRVLHVNGTSISNQGYETLRRELPNTKIYWSERKTSEFEGTAK